MKGILPESFLRCLSPEDRKSLGKGGMTAEEALTKQVARTERDLQRMIVGLLRLKGIEPCWHRMDKKSAATVGWPDITFSVRWEMKTPMGPLQKTYPCAWEVKLNGELSEDQVAMKVILQTPPNFWRYREIRSIDEALAELRAMGIE